MKNSGTAELAFAVLRFFVSVLMPVAALLYVSAQLFGAVVLQDSYNVLLCMRDPDVQVCFLEKRYEKHESN